MLGSSNLRSGFPTITVFKILQTGQNVNPYRTLIILKATVYDQRMGESAMRKDTVHRSPCLRGLAFVSPPLILW